MTSAVAGILDRNGDLRVVVTQRWRMRNHLNKGEQLFVVPNCEVDEPVPWDKIPALIHKVHLHVAKSKAPVNHCEQCMACCKTFHILSKEFEKPSHKLCNHACSIGCEIYWRRPDPCKAFRCEWLKSQSRNDPMPPELRPDRCGVIFSEDTQTKSPLKLEVHPDISMYPDREIKNRAVKLFIESMQAIGYEFKLITYYIGEK